MGVDLLFHDGEYTPGEYDSRVDWGHSVYTDALKLGMESGAKELGLFHLNQERTDLEVDIIVEDCRRIIGENNSSLFCFAVPSDETFIL